MRKTKPVARMNASRGKKLAAAKLDELIEAATVDAYDESEQTTGFFTMFEEHLTLPFSTEVVGVEVTVERIDITDDLQIVAVCARGRSRQRIPITELPLPDPLPKNFYELWMRRIHVASASSSCYSWHHEEGRTLAIEA